MSRLCVRDTTPITYIDRRQLLRSQQTERVFRAAQQTLQDQSCTLYVGNLSYFTREAQIIAYFSPFGHVRDVLMGLSDGGGAGISNSTGGYSGGPPALMAMDEVKSPCGFCFVVYEERAAAVAAQHALHKSLLDDRIIHVGWDVGLATTVLAPGSGAGSSSFSPTTTTTSSSLARLGDHPLYNTTTTTNNNNNTNNSSSVTASASLQLSAAAVEAALSRRWGRGAHGGQVVDSVRQTLDDGRGGLGALRKASLGIPSTGGGSGAGSLTVEASNSSSSALRTPLRAANVLLRRHGGVAAPAVAVQRLREVWNACNGVEGEGLDMSYYWIEGRQRRWQHKRGSGASASWQQQQRQQRSKKADQTAVKKRV